MGVSGEVTEARQWKLFGGACQVLDTCVQGCEGYKGTLLETIDFTISCQYVSPVTEHKTCQATTRRSKPFQATYGKDLTKGGEDVRTGRCAPQARSRDVAMKEKLPKMWPWKKNGPEDENMASPVPTSEEKMLAKTFCESKPSATTRKGACSKVFGVTRR